MYDTVRWILLGLLFVGLFGLWLWSRRQAAGHGPLGSNPGSSFKVLQKRWVDQRTGVCLVEAEEQTFLLAYTVGGGVSWQVLEKPAVAPEDSSGRLVIKGILPKTERQ
jgi:hypothetical protein